jgi:hypothetical protein
MDVWIDGGGFAAFWYSYGYMSRIPRPASLHGYSAGALVCVLLTCDVDDVLDAALAVLSDCTFGTVGDALRRFVETLLPCDAHLRASNYVHIALSDPSAWYKTKIVNSWDTRQDLVDCLVAACFIPGFMGAHRKDPVYGCLDATFAPDLDDYRVNLMRVTPRAADLSLIDRDTAMGYYAQGAIEGFLKAEIKNIGLHNIGL